MNNMVGAPGCSVDGTVSGANPLGRVVDQFLTMGPGGAQGRMVGQAGPGGLRNGMQSGFNAAQQQRAQRIHQQQHQQQQQQQQRGGPPMDEIWRAQQRGGRGGPAMPQQQHRRGAEWAAQAAQHGSGGMDAAFAAAQSGGQRSAMPRSQGPRMAARGPMMGGPMMGGPMMGGPMMGGPMMGGMGMNPMMMGGGGMMGGGMMGMQQPMYHGGPHLQQASGQRMMQPPPPQQQQQPTPLPPQARAKQEGPAIEIMQDDQVLDPVDQQTTEQPPQSDMAETRAMTREMVRVLEQDPKFQNSEFLGFMQSISKGEVEFNGNQLKSGDQKSMEDAAQEALSEPATTTTTTAAPKQDLEARMAEAWKDTMDGKEVDMNAIWSEALAQGESFEGLGNMFGEMGLDGETMFGNQLGNQLAAPSVDQYQLPKENQYRGSQENLFEVGMVQFNQGSIAEAIEAFQAYVESETEDSSEGWRMLGVSHQEHDEDRKAIQCLEKSVEEDPYNLER